jgi:pyrophosphate--fructose-6-phosphate 1-phosphotransferase
MNTTADKDIENLLKHPKTVEVTSDVNKESLERRSFVPSRIKTFESHYVGLEEQPRYRLLKDQEAEKVLPDIVDNQVEKVVKDPDKSQEEKRFFDKKRNIGIVFSGGPAPGGHNVIAGLFDQARRVNPESRIYGFLLGPDGIIDGKYMELTEKLVDTYRNMGGFSMIKTGRTKIDSKKKMEDACRVCRELDLDAVVIVGGDDSNTNAAFLAQEFKDVGIQVIGVPKTIDGDIQVHTEDGDVLCAISVFIRRQEGLPRTSPISPTTPVPMSNTGMSAK